jgi:hypothetical protein
MHIFRRDNDEFLRTANTASTRYAFFSHAEFQEFTLRVASVTSPPKVATLVLIMMGLYRIRR